MIEDGRRYTGRHSPLHASSLALRQAVIMQPLTPPPPTPVPMAPIVQDVYADIIRQHWERQGKPQP